MVNSKKSNIKYQRKEGIQELQVVVSSKSWVALQKYLEVRKLSEDRFGGLHKMSVVQKKWTGVHEDYLLEGKQRTSVRRFASGWKSPCRIRKDRVHDVNPYGSRRELGKSENITLQLGEFFEQKKSS
uniref:Uncharacterized protein n=1 Tax=Lactuca sativa TaxID=4236 RepID=A0A9R1V1G6_LACSA|nr:hypothetical protein LSAT_V11C700372100 [Lactuca sativa]